MSPAHVRARWVPLIGMFAMTLASARVEAQTIDARKVGTAKALFENATADMAARRFDAACPKLEEAVRLVPEGVGAQFALGECYEGAGKLASAWSQFVLTEANATRAGQAERASRAAARAAALKLRLVKLSIVVSQEVRAIPGLTVTRDNLAVSPVEFSVPIPLDPGVHDVVAAAPSYKPWRQQVTLTKEGTASTLEITTLAPQVAVPALVPPPDVRPVQGADNASPEVLSSAPVSQPRAWQRPTGLVTAGLGAAGVGLGAILGGLAIGKYGDSNNANDPAYCNASNVCGSKGLSARDSAYGFATASTAAMIVGGVMLAGGAVVYWTAPRGLGRDTTARLDVSPTGLCLRGTW